MPCRSAILLQRLGKLVWARAPPHPWWPGEICVPLASQALTIIPPTDDTRRILVLFFGDSSFEAVDPKMALSFDPAKPRQLVDAKSTGKKAVFGAVKEALDRAHHLKLISGMDSRVLASFRHNGDGIYDMLFRRAC